MTRKRSAEVISPCPLGQGHETHPAGWCCGAKLKRRDGYDARRAGWGTDHVGAGPCKLHLGSTRNHRKAAHNELERRQVEGRIGEFMEQHKLDPATVNYADVLAEKVVVAHGMSLLIESMLGQADVGELHGPDHLGDDRPHVLTEMLRVWTVEAAKLSKLAIDAGVDERRVRVLESQSRHLVEMQEQIFLGVFAALIAAGVARELLERVRRDELPKIIRGVVAGADG